MTTKTPTTPIGLPAPSLAYTRHLPFAQGRAFEIIYDLSPDHDVTAELARAAELLEDALRHDAVYSAFDKVFHFPPLYSYATRRANLLMGIAIGQITDTLDQLEHLAAADPQVLIDLASDAGAADISAEYAVFSDDEMDAANADEEQRAD